MSSKLIVALDFDDDKDAMTFVDQVDPALCALKVGSEMFTLFGAPFVRSLVAKRFNVFLDLKFHDIPNTVSRACKASADLGVWMLNVHASGGLKMMEAARKSIDSFGLSRPLLIAVTLLTSLGPEDLIAMGVTESLADRANTLACLAQQAGLDGVVSSPHEVPRIKESCGNDFISVTPGIRLSSSSQDDQIRIMPPERAIEEGSDYLVIGRPITRSPEPRQVVLDLLERIKTA